jgi:transcription initiation factor TFIIIB Brf1 subunit/transcription initiation factor TFIIB
LDSDTACPKGGEHKLVEDIPGEKSCTKCGITIKVHEGTGDNPLIDEHVTGSDVGKDNKEFRKIARHHKFVPGLSFAREVALAKRQIEICSPILLKPRLRTRALALFKKTRKPLKGKNFETFVGACIFIACREQGMPIHRLAKATSIDQREFGALFSWKDTKLVRYYKEICNHLEIPLPPDKAINNVEWIGKRVEYSMDEETLKLPGSVIREATKLLSKVPDSETGSNPVGIAAAMLYIVSVTSGHPFTQKQFAEAAKVNSQTVTKSAKRLNSVIKKNKLGKYVDHNTRYHRIV